MSKNRDGGFTLTGVAGENAENLLRGIAMLWIERVFACLTVFVCWALATDSRNVALARERDTRPREPVLQSRGGQAVHRLR